MEETILLAHGGGGRLSMELISNEIVTRFGSGPLSLLDDSALLDVAHADKILFSTDSYVVQPLEFPGGNIGDLAVNGTVNDISVSGGRALWLSLALIVEEGMKLSLFRKILDTIKTASDSCDIKIVTGDTKVVPRGQCDGLYINTSGVGVLYDSFQLGKSDIAEGDSIIVSGTIADHGIAVMAHRESLTIKDGLSSDTGSVGRLVHSIRDFGKDVKFMRDPTRGGVAMVLNEIVDGQDFGILLDSEKIPVKETTNTVAEMLGIDCLNVACEGRVILICSACIKDEILDIWKCFPEGEGAAEIGRVTNKSGYVILETLTGGTRIVDLPTGEMLPRIC